MYIIYTFRYKKKQPKIADFGLELIQIWSLKKNTDPIAKKKDRSLKKDKHAIAQ